jgi:hypothetical protein
VLVVFDTAMGQGTHQQRYAGGNKMSKRKLKGVFAKVVCAGARSGIVAALYLAAFLAALQLAAVLPEPWSAVGITALLLVVGLSLFGRWPGHRFRLESVGLGYQPDGQARNPQAAAPVSPRGVLLRSRPVLGVILGCR